MRPENQKSPWRTADIVCGLIGEEPPDFTGPQTLTWADTCHHLGLSSSSSFFFLFLFIYFLEREEGREKVRERNINVWLPLMRPLLVTWPATQAGALTRNQTRDPLVCRPMLNSLSYTSQGLSSSFSKPCGIYILHCFWSYS